MRSAVRGWAEGRENGEVLRAAEGTFDVPLTADQSVYDQQDFSAAPPVALPPIPPFNFGEGGA